VAKSSAAARGTKSSPATKKTAAAAKTPAGTTPGAKSTAKPAAAKNLATKAPATKAPASEAARAKAAQAKAAQAKAAPAKTSSAAEKKAPVRKGTTSKQSAATKSPPAAKSAAKAAAAGGGGGAGKAPAKKAAATTTATNKASGSPPEGWTARELAAVRKDLQAQLTQMRADYEQTLRAIDELQSQSSDSAGDDQADAGSKTLEREHEMSLAKNRRDLISQIEHAVERIDKGRYGLCESCGTPIAKARLQAFPGATLCVTCKQREERR